MPIEGGYILKPRIIQTSEIANKPPHFREIWDWLIRNANYADRRIYGKTIKRGQVLTTYNTIIQDLSWEVGGRPGTYTRNDVQCAFRYFKRANMITTAKSTHKTIITICKYDYWQNSNNYEIHSEIHDEIQSKSTASPQDKQELKNERNKKRSVSKIDTHTHTFSFPEVEVCFKKWESELALSAKPGAALNFIANQEKNGWKFNSKPIALDDHVKAWIYKDSAELEGNERKNHEPKKSKLAI